MSTEARWLIRDGDRGKRGGKSEGSTADTAQKRLERPWTATRTMEVLRRCPLAIAQQLVHCAIAVSTAVWGSHKYNVCCTAAEVKEVQLSQPHLPPLDLAWYLDSNLSTSIIFSVIVLSSKRGVTHTTGSLLGPLCANTFLHQVSSQ